MAVDLSIGPPGEPEVEAEPGAGDELLGDELLEEAPPVDPSVVRGLLGGLGGTLGYLVGDDDVDDHWHFTPGELDALTPPITRIVNRTPRLRRAVMRGDELTVAVVLAGYAGRNVAAGRQAKEARHDDDELGEAPFTAGPAGAAGADAPGGARRNGLHGDGVRPAPGGGLR